MFGGEIVDLTQEIYQGMPVYPGHLKTVVWTHLSHEECQRQLGTIFLMRHEASYYATMAQHILIQ